MKKLFVIMSILLSLSLSQLNGQTIIDEVKEQIVLDGTWRFSPDDSKEYAFSDYNDSRWEKIFLPTTILLQDDHAFYTRWIRTEVIISSKLQDVDLFLLAGKRKGAVKIYFNGITIGSHGKFPPDFRFLDGRPLQYHIPAGIINYDGNNIISIRNSRDVRGYEIPLISIGNNDHYLHEKVFISFLNADVYRYFAFICFFIASVLIFQFIFFRKDFTKLKFGIANLLLTFYFYIFSPASESFLTIEVLAFSKSIFPLAIGLTVLFLIEKFEIFNNKPLKSIILLQAAFFFLLINLFTENTGDIDFFIILYSIIMELEILLECVIVIIAVIRKKDDALYIAIFILTAAFFGTYDIYFVIIQAVPLFWMQGYALFLYNLGIFIVISSTEKRDHFALERYSREIERKVEEKTLELNNTNKRLRSALADSKAAVRAKSLFLANISHEMRTPLHCVIGYSEIALEDERETETGRMINKIIGESERLHKLINDLIDLAKSESGKLDINRHTFNLSEFLTDFELLVKTAAGKKKLHLEIRRGENFPEVINGDKFRIRQILENIVGNAIKFTDSGEIIISVSLSRNRSILNFSIKDTGIGIALSEQDRIFDSFVQADNNLENKHAGTGLGTAISKQLVELMGGQIQLASEVGKGSEFSFFIPIGNFEDNEDDTQKLLPSVDTKKLMKKFRILLVEDYPPNRDIAIQYLKSLKCEVVIAVCGKDALSRFEESSFELILMDIQMPEMNGIEATRIIRRLPGGKALPIIGVTANAFSEDLVKYKEAGMNAVIVKPMRKDKFLAEIIKWVTIDYIDVPDYEGIPLDIKSLLDEFEGDKKDVKKIISKFLVLVEKQLVVLTESIKKKDYKIIHNEAHSIKGGAKNLFADNLAAAAFILENKAKQKKTGINQKDIDLISLEFNKFKKYFEEEIREFN